MCVLRTIVRNTKFKITDDALDPVSFIYHYLHFRRMTQAQLQIYTLTDIEVLTLHIQKALEELNWQIT